MNPIHHPSRSVSILFLIVAIAFTQTTFGANKHSAKRGKPERASDRKSSARSNRHERREDLSPKRRRGAERRQAEARRRAEAARLAAAARQHALEEAMRNSVQSMIASDDTAGEDPEVRRIAVNALGNHAGTVVVMDPQTGRIYSIVNQQWALHEGFKPCSTIKLVTGLAGLNEKVIDPADTAAISDSNRVTLTSALAHSKNEYFQTVGGQVGFTKMISYAHQLGLGERTGINIRNEFAGRVPAFKSGFAVNHMSSHGDDFKVTAVQLATLVSAIANGGNLLIPFVPRTKDESQPATKVRRSVNMTAESFKEMLPGMIGSVSYGSGRRASNPLETVLGKTGTCIEQGTWVGLFTSYAPVINPKLAVVVIARGVDGRNHFPAAVAGRIYRDLNGRFGTPVNMQIAKHDSGADSGLTPSRTSTTKVEEITDDDEESDETDSVKTNGISTAPVVKTPETIWGDARKPADSKVKRVVMPIPTRKSVTNAPAVTPKDAATMKPQTMERARRVLPVQN
ncbi:MAG: penicillin-binding transpeptidase domain-containing protein [Acidobacteriota bacterium]